MVHTYRCLLPGETITILLLGVVAESDWYASSLETYYSIEGNLAGNLANDHRFTKVSYLPK